MKVRIAHAVLACFGAALMLAAPVAANAAELSASGRPLKPGQFNPANETVELFEGVKKGQLEVKMVHKDVAQGKVFITNKTGKPVNVKLPDAFVGVHVLAQGMGGMGGMGGGMGGGGAQMSGGGMGGGGGAGGGGAGGGGNFFNVAAEKVGEVPFVSVCLEHGKADPRAAMKYEMRSPESIGMKPEVRETIKLLAEGKLTQRVAQVLAWHHQNEMSFEELAAKMIKPLTGPQVPYFHPEEIRAAMQAKAYIAKQLEEKSQGSSAALPKL